MRQADAERLIHEFVEFIPDRPEEGTLYVSVTYATAVHLCCCGCGNEVVTPFSPRDWKVTFDGEAVSLHPSIGNWGFSCQSHYWIKGNRVVWARQWSPEKVEATRRQERPLREGKVEGVVALPEPDAGGQNASIWARLKAWWARHRIGG